MNLHLIPSASCPTWNAEGSVMSAQVFMSGQRTYKQLHKFCYCRFYSSGLKSWKLTLWSFLLKVTLAEGQAEKDLTRRQGHLLNICYFDLATVMTFLSTSGTNKGSPVCWDRTKEASGSQVTEPKWLDTWVKLLKWGSGVQASQHPVTGAYSAQLPGGLLWHTPIWDPLLLPRLPSTCPLHDASHTPCPAKWCH